ncbi:MAG TPA: thioredoxin domain-containing protein [Gammaproteobacteria bacterium]|nr:thioredoxin domain-containing protein [Gammaproteobacteria bacterium]
MNNSNNLLTSETSPYLLQHANNPVNWHAWNNQALTRAKQENKPILLSIGYSACHWCHVMAHESFEDDDTARIMNEHFINIKVDREERPDLDKIYQNAHSILTGRPGGWPLTVFLTPDDHMPFFAGTYFPKQRRYGMPSFSELLLNVHQIFTERLDDITLQNNSLRELLIKDNLPTAASSSLTALPLDMARRQLLAAFDPQNGGFSKAPKFPHPAMLERALRQWCLTCTPKNNDQTILEITDLSLKKMAMGGVFDHIGGGFCRYSTDDFWMIPHFEKMLYDNGQLLPLYTFVWQLSGDTLFNNTIRQTADWVIREMQSPAGGYYSAQDADSEGEEGKFYVWTRDEISKLIDADDYDVFSACYGLDRTANFEHRWHLHRYAGDTELARTFSTTEDEISTILSRCCNKLFEARAKRIAPGTDDKILTSWNGLMIRGMCLAGRVTDNHKYIASAFQALEFVRKTMWHDGRFFATSNNNKTHLNAYLDDYAHMLLAIIEYLQCHWDNTMLDWANAIAESLLNNFEDKVNGGFYFTSHDHEQLIQRIKTFSDDAMPAGNAIAALGLQRLGFLTGNTHFLTAAEKTLQAASADMNQHAVLHCSMLNALEEYLNPPVIIILRGKLTELKHWQQQINQWYLPRTFCFAIADDITPNQSLADKKSTGDICAYICEGTMCLPPVYNIDDLNKYLKARNPHLGNP